MTIGKCIRVLERRAAHLDRRVSERGGGADTNYDKEEASAIRRAVRFINDNRKEDPNAQDHEGHRND